MSGNDGTAGADTVAGDTGTIDPLGGSARSEDAVPHGDETNDDDAKTEYREEMDK